MSESREAELLARIAALEQSVEELRREVRGQRASPRIERVVEALSDESPRAIPPVPPRAAPQQRKPPKPRADLETLVGRYGMLALATVLALTAAGTFVMWAISHGLLGPAARVALGLAAAAAIAVWGTRLRRRERSFGDSLLGLSLGIVQVCAWAAGPALHLIPPVAALALSAAASVALSAFALLEGDEPLWCVGFGGAAIAPFVTSTGQGTAPMLAGYAAAVLIAAGVALGSRRWTIAARVFAAAAALFMGSVLAMPLSQRSAELALLLPFAVAAFGVAPFAHGEMLRPRIRTLGLLAAGAAVHVGFAQGLPEAEAEIILGVAALLWFVAVEKFEIEPPGRVLDGLGDGAGEVPEWIDGALIPLLFGLSLEIVLDRHGASPTALALFATVAGVSAARRSAGALRDALAFSCMAAAMLVAVIVASPSTPVAHRYPFTPLEIAAAASVAALFALLESPVPNRTWRWAPNLALAIASGLAVLELHARPPFGYVPFLTAASGAAAVVLIGWAAALRLPGPAARIGLGAFLFLWVHEELASAFAPNVAALLLVSWYAVGSVAAVGAGRSLAVPRLRHVGLCLGAIAAFLALKIAWRLDNTAARIGSYLVVSVFLLGIAWWYRRPGSASAAEAS